MPEVTFVLPSRSRVPNLSRILAVAERCPQISQIMIIHDSPESPYTLEDVIEQTSWVNKPVEVLATSKRRYAITRYEFLDRINTEYICTCDDDWLLVDGWDHLLGAHFSRPDPYTGITCYLPPSHRWMVKPRILQHGVVMHEILLGWGAVFHVDAPKRAFSHWISRFGEDELLIRNGDRLFSMLCDRPHLCLPIRDKPWVTGESRGERLPFNDNLALEHMPDHYSTAEIVRNRCLQEIKQKQVEDLNLILGRQ